MFEEEQRHKSSKLIDILAGPVIVIGCWALAELMAMGTVISNLQDPKKTPANKKAIAESVIKTNESNVSYIMGYAARAYANNYLTNNQETQK